MSTRTKHREVRGGVVAKKSVRIRQQHFSKSSEGQIPGVLDFGPAIRDPLIDLLWRKNGTDRPSYRGPQESPPPPHPRYATKVEFTKERHIASAPCVETPPAPLSQEPFVPTSDMAWARATPRASRYGGAGPPLSKVNGCGRSRHGWRQ